MKKYLFISVLLVSCVFALNAQTKNELQIGLSMPRGDFADDNADDAISSGSGIASTGFYLGYKLLSPLKTNGLFWTLNVGIIYNDLQKDYKDDMDDVYSDFNDYSLPKYINIPVLAGLQYEKTLSNDLKLFGEAGLGLNILKLTNMTFSDVDFESSTTFKPSSSLGYKIGAGVVLQDKYTIALNYMDLGSHKVKFDYETVYSGNRDSGDDKFDKALPVRTLNITFGIRF